MWRALRRSLRYFTHTRPGLPVGCIEWKILPRLARIVWTFPASAGAAIRCEASEDPARYRTLRNASDLDVAVERLGRDGLCLFVDRRRQYLAS
jgi:hypothetical protein